jgi:hypothetical protein
VTNLQAKSKIVLKRGYSYMHILPVCYSDASVVETATTRQLQQHGFDQPWWGEEAVKPPKPKPPTPEEEAAAAARPAVVPDNVPIHAQVVTINDIPIVEGGGKNRPPPKEPGSDDSDYEHDIYFRDPSKQTLPLPDMEEEDEEQEQEQDQTDAPAEEEEEPEVVWTPAKKKKNDTD